jgi:cold shock CspA family protein
MAKSNSFNKREIEKNKSQKRKEKQLKREARKLEPSDSFEDMIAYVDANGMITSERPEPSKAEEIKLEDIEISIPPREEEEKTGDPTGRVEFFDESRGFGFIKEADSPRKFFFHKSNAEYGIAENDLVSYRLENGLKGVNAVDIKIVR